MKIGFIGNTNNYPFIIAKKLRDAGHEILFIVDEPASEKLHRPEHHIFNIPFPYPSWIKEDLFPVNILRLIFPSFFSRSVIKKLNSCDAVILNGLWHGIKLKLKKGIPSVSIFSGADLDVYACYDQFQHFLLSHSKTRLFPQIFVKKLARKFVKNHRAGIQSACCYSYFPPGSIPEGDNILKEIFQGPGNKAVRFNHCHVITDTVSYIPPPENDPLKIINVARFVWKQPLPAGYNQAEAKGNDIMIRALGIFLQEHKTRLDIHFVEKGIHVPETKMLIREYGFEDMVTWHKEVPFSDFMNFLASGDIIFEQLGNHVFTGGLYPMLIGRPVIANGRPEIFEPIMAERSPLCQAKTVEEVKYWLEKLTTDKQARKDIGIRSREYVLKHFDITDEALFFAEQLKKNL
jgi:glycosyltransferase involved in cell wall biosynthesis